MCSLKVCCVETTLDKGDPTTKIVGAPKTWTLAARRASSRSRYSRRTPVTPVTSKNARRFSDTFIVENTWYARKQKGCWSIRVLVMTDHIMMVFVVCSSFLKINGMSKVDWNLHLMIGGWTEHGWCIIIVVWIWMNLLQLGSLIVDIHSPSFVFFLNLSHARNAEFGHKNQQMLRCWKGSKVHLPLVFAPLGQLSN